MFEKSYYLLFLLCIITAVMVSGCTTTVSNKYYQINVSDKFISGSNAGFITTTDSETIKIGRYCYSEHKPCYSVFTINNNYVVKLGVEDNVFSQSDIVIEEIIMERGH